jgi:energy-coupling factor transporter ATP-binding protein EcfA2
VDAKQDKTLVDCREHVLYCGVTQSGKTTLARHHARILSRAGYDIAIYDPVNTATHGGGWPDGAQIMDSPELFHKYVDRANGEPERPIFLFVDECADIFGHSETHAHWIPRQIRHRNIYLRMIVQRPKMLHPNVRTQCAYAYILRLARDDLKIICADYGHGSEIAPETIDRGDCMLLTSGSPTVEYFNVFDLVKPARQSR